MQIIVVASIEAEQYAFENCWSFFIVTLYNILYYANKTNILMIMICKWRYGLQDTVLEYLPEITSKPQVQKQV